MLLERLLDPAVVWVVIPVTAIVMGCLTAIVKSVIKHRERMAKIGMGIDPDLSSNLAPADPSGSSWQPSDRLSQVRR
jgi:hypothetical protein